MIWRERFLDKGYKIRTAQLLTSVLFGDATEFIFTIFNAVSSICQEKIDLILLFVGLWYMKEVNMKEKETILSVDFPFKLNELRKIRGWFKGQLAKKIGADLQRISKYERGVIWPTMELTLKIAKAFDVSVDFAIWDDKDTAVSKIENQKLLQPLEDINDLPEDDQETVISFLDAFIKRRKFEELVHEYR